MPQQNIQYRLLNDFNDPSISPEIWNELVENSPVNEIFLTWEWQQTWWASFGRGKLILIAAEEEGKLLAIAPLFADGGMVFFVGSGGSDYLDFIGDIAQPGLMEHFLSIAEAETPGFCGFRFYHIPDHSPTGNQLFKVTGSGKWVIYDEGFLPSPYLDIKTFPDQARQATLKKSLIRHENWFRRSGNLEIIHLTKKEDILPNLSSFIQQHRSRWSSTNYPSLFEEESQRQFYIRLCYNLTSKKFLQFSIIKWQKISIAYHFGFLYKKKFIWYKPSFDIEYSKKSPGEVLIRQLLLKAIQDQTKIFDFGLGDESFKKRFSTNCNIVRTLGLYHR